MSTAAEDYESSKRMMMDSYWELSTLESGHELLKHCLLDSDKQGFRFTQEFWDRYPLETHPNNMDIEYEYTHLLNIAINELSHRNSHHRHLPE